MIGGGGIGRPPDRALYRDEDFLWICGAQRSQSSNTLVTPPLALSEVFLSDLSERIRRGGPLI